MFAIDSSPSTQSSLKILLNDFGSACTFDELQSGCMRGTRRLYYEPGYFGAAADLCALVRSVFVLTQLTFDPTEASTSNELDEIMTKGKQLSIWTLALGYATKCDYDGLASVLESG